MDSEESPIETEQAPVVPVPAPVPVTAVPELDDVSLSVPTEPVGEGVEAEKENVAENGDERDENVSKILNRNYYQIAHDLQQHDGSGGNSHFD